jgi:modulator of FtsH protease HflK
VIGRSLIQNILTADRKVIEPAVQDLAQKILDKYKAGVLILQVQLQSVDPPQEVITAFRDVTAAQQDRDRMRNEAQTYANNVVPAAQGQAAAIRQQAEGYRLQTIDEATGQASRFSQVEAQYKIAPALTRERIYLETMEQVLAGSDKVIVDSGNGQSVLPYLPLPLQAPNTSVDGATK